MKPFLLLPVVLGALSALPGRAAPQTLTPIGSDDPVASADRLFDEDRPLDAYDLLEAYLGRRPDDYDARWKAARSAVALGIMAGDERLEEVWLERGIEQARHAVELRPDGVEGLYWLVASRGWLAMVVGNPKRIADLADDVLADARRLLEMEPGHPGAHHALGKLHYEVMTLSAFERFLAKHLLGVDVASFASWDASAEHLAKAIERDPDMVLYHLDLGMTQIRQGRRDAARESLRSALALPATLPPDPLFQRRARTLLDELGPGPDARPTGGASGRLRP